jgi:hypothetical protein
MKVRRMTMRQIQIDKGRPRGAVDLRASGDWPGAALTSRR